MPRRMLRAAAICMRRPLVVVVAGFLVLSAIAVGDAGALVVRPLRGHTTVNVGGAFVPTHGVAADLHSTVVDSANWSGYVDKGTGISSVSTNFVVPGVNPFPPGGFAGLWAGIGGVDSSDLIQAGVSVQTLPSLPLVGPQYYAWYELLPGGEIPLTDCTAVGTGKAVTCAVAPGDAMAVNIQSVGGSSSKWTITMANFTLGWTSTTPVADYKSSESSAEWILEAPTLLVLQSYLANVGRVAFTNSTFTEDGALKTIASGGPAQFDLTEPIILPVIEGATPSALGPDGKSFNDCAYARSCPAP